MFPNRTSNGTRESCRIKITLFSRRCLTRNRAFHPFNVQTELAESETPASRQRLGSPHPTESSASCEISTSHRNETCLIFLGYR